MANLLDSLQNAGGGLLNFLGAIPQAAQGQFGQPPAVDPALTSLLTPEQQAVAAANYRRNMAAGMQAAAAKGQSLGGMGAFAAQTADPQYNADIMRSVQDAMLLRQMRMLNSNAGQSTDPFAQMQYGAGLAQVGLPGSQQVMDAAKAQISPAVLALHNARLAASQGDTAAATSYYIQHLKETGRINISDRTGTLTLLGGVNPEDLKYVSIDPNTHTITGPASQKLIAGGTAVEQANAKAKALGGAAATFIPVENGDGSTTQTPVPVALGQLGGSPGAVAPAAPGAATPPMARPPGAVRAPAPVSPSAVPSLNSGFPLASQPQMQGALKDPGYVLQTPPPVLGRSLTPDQADTQKDVAKARTELKQFTDEATSGAANTLTFVKAAQAVLNGGAPTGLTAQTQAGFSRYLASVHMTDGTAAQKSQLLVKYLGNLALSNAKQTFGPRLTQKEVQIQLEELSPNQAMQDGTIGEMLDKLGRISQYAIDSADRTRYYLAAQNGRNDPRDFFKWNQAHFPMAEETTPPVAGDHPPEILNLLKKYPARQ